MEKDILFFGLHRPNRSPSQRYRIEQFLPYLDEKGITYDYDYLLNQERDIIFYSAKNPLGKLYILLFSFCKLLYLAFFKAKRYKTIFVQREAFMLGTAFFEKQMAKCSRLVFDFDDSIWMQNVSEANRRWAFLKNAAKTSEIIEVAHTNIVGNEFLKEYALKFSKNVVLIPTCVDTLEYSRNKPLSTKEDGRVCIGWSGSLTTIEHFKLALPLIKRIRKTFGEKVYFKVLGDASFNIPELGIQGVRWSRDTEIESLQEFDIGIMPLPEDEWSKGKCGLKALVYMSMELPAVIQNFGANREIIEDGIQGYLCSTEDEWFESMSKLIGNAELRTKMGLKGRQRVENQYSVESQKNLFLSSIRVF